MLIYQYIQNWLYIGMDSILNQLTETDKIIIRLECTKVQTETASSTKSKVGMFGTTIRGPRYSQASH